MIISMKKKAFTLAEMVLALMIFWLIFGAIMSIYTRMINVKREFDARNQLLTSTYTMLEKINILLKDYTIDYEEYFNRSMHGCASVGLMSWRSVGTTWYCTTYDGYGNINPFTGLTTLGASLANANWHALYRCSSTTDYIDDTTFAYVVNDPAVLTWSGCVLSGEPQSFGEYRQQFVDVKDNADEKPSPIGDDDDTDLGKWPVAITDNQDVPELYLISKDKKSRLFLRRKLITQQDINNNGAIEPHEKFYVIQMLQLRGFDAGTVHTFDAADPNNQYMYDGQADTRACDYAKWFVCHGSGVNALIYTGYNLPADAEDGWVNLFGNDITVADWHMQIYPQKDPIYAWSENDMQINPYINIFLTTYLYSPAWYTKLQSNVFDKISYSLQTTFNIKTNY